jgi:predicted NBD/HSP70 family sugar kinase
LASASSSRVFYVLITAALGGGLVIDGHYCRGANGRSGGLGLILRRDAKGELRQLQHIVSLSALYDCLAAWCSAVLSGANCNGRRAASA